MAANDLGQILLSALQGGAAPLSSVPQDPTEPPILPELVQPDRLRGKQLGVLTLADVLTTIGRGLNPAVPPARARDTFRALAERRADRTNRAAQLDARRENRAREIRNATRVRAQDRGEERTFREEQATQQREFQDAQREDTQAFQAEQAKLADERQAANTAALARIRSDAKNDPLKLALAQDAFATLKEAQQAEAAALAEGTYEGVTRAEARTKFENALRTSIVGEGEDVEPFVALGMAFWDRTIGPQIAEQVEAPPPAAGAGLPEPFGSAFRFGPQALDLAKILAPIAASAGRIPR